MLSQMEDVDSHGRIVMVRGVVLLISMEAWTIQLFLCLMSKGSTHVEKADEAPFPFAQRNSKPRQGLTTACQTRYDKHFVKILKPCLGSNLWPVSLLIFM